MHLILILGWSVCGQCYEIKTYALYVVDNKKGICQATLNVTFTIALTLNPQTFSSCFTNTNKIL